MNTYYICMENLIFRNKSKSLKSPFEFIVSLCFRINFLIIYFLRALFAVTLSGEQCIRCGEDRCILPLCRKCRSLILKNILVEKSRCRVCGKELVSQNEICSYCRKGSIIRSVDGVFPIETYQLWKKTLLFEWKTVGKRSLSFFFAQMMDCFIRKNFVSESQIDHFKKVVIVPVPPRPGKIRKKGWDQIDEMCFYLKWKYGYEILPVLKRRSRIQQKKLDMEQRLETIGKNYYKKKDSSLRKIFRKSGGVPEQAIIVDDVMTTGATVENCAEVLKSMGIKKVYGVTLFGV